MLASPPHRICQSAHIPSHSSKNKVFERVVLLSPLGSELWIWPAPPPVAMMNCREATARALGRGGPSSGSSPTHGCWFAFILPEPAQERAFISGHASGLKSRRAFTTWIMYNILGTRATTNSLHQKSHADQEAAHESNNQIFAKSNPTVLCELNSPKNTR